MTYSTSDQQNCPRIKSSLSNLPATRTMAPIKNVEIRDMLQAILQKLKHLEREVSALRQERQPIPEEEIVDLADTEDPETPDAPDAPDEHNSDTSGRKADSPERNTVSAQKKRKAGSPECNTAPAQKKRKTREGVIKDVPDATTATRRITRSTRSTQVVATPTTPEPTNGKRKARVRAESSSEDEAEAPKGLSLSKFNSKQLHDMLTKYRGVLTNLGPKDDDDEDQATKRKRLGWALTAIERQLRIVNTKRFLRKYPPKKPIKPASGSDEDESGDEEEPTQQESNEEPEEPEDDDGEDDDGEPTQPESSSSEDSEDESSNGEPVDEDTPVEEEESKEANDDPDRPDLADIPAEDATTEDATAGGAPSFDLYRGDITDEFADLLLLSANNDDHADLPSAQATTKA
jgi:hypothetical protein